MGRIACARGDTVTKNTFDWSAITCKGGAAEALVGVFKTDVVVTFALAVIHATIDSHIIGPPGIGGKGTVDATVCATAKICPARIG